MLLIFSLLPLLTFGMILAFSIVYSYLAITSSESELEDYRNIHPFKLWLIADDGLFAAADTLDRDDDNYESSRAYEDRILNNAMSEIEKQIALDNLKEKSFA